jgi:hypothetical protein
MTVSHPQSAQPSTVTKRLEKALGGDMTRFLLSALAVRPPARREPR